MSKRWYGSIDNRIEEGRNYEPDKKIKEGTDITVYYWSDRHCKYVTKVVDQKHIFVKDWHVCADHSKPGGAGHQDWMYFKTAREEQEYLDNYYMSNDKARLEYEKCLGRKYECANYDEIKESSPEEWVFRYGHWNRVVRFTKADVERIKERDGWCRLYPKTEKEKEAFEAGKEVVQYSRISEGISFGVREYYYDWEF